MLPSLYLTAHIRIHIVAFEEHLPDEDSPEQTHYGALKPCSEPAVLILPFLELHLLVTLSTDRGWDYQQEKPKSLGNQRKGSQTGLLAHKTHFIYLLFLYF